MFRKQVRSFSIFLLLGILILTACTPKATPSPTVNPDDIRTQAMQTVQAQLTQTALAAPSATPTFTVVPTNTPEPATPTLSITLPPTALATTQVFLPTNTLSSGIRDQATYVSQSPSDGTVFAPAQTFTMTWRLKNTGPTTWTTQYKFRFYAGSGGRMGAADINLPRDVAPNSEIDITLQMTAPLTAGEYNTIWVLSNQDGINFSQVYLLFKVSGSTLTPTRPPATATIAPTNTVAPTNTIVVPTETPTETATP